MKQRNYKKEYQDYQGKPEQIRNRSNRNKARRLAEKKYGASKIEGKDIDHADGNPMNNSLNNLKITTKSYNRSKK